MFICEKCLTKKYANQTSISQSIGPCECCGKQAICSDIPSSLLRRKKRTPSSRYGTEH